jgi:putative transposase
MPASEESLALKLNLEPSLEEINSLDGQSRICNWLYNHLLEIALNLKTQFCQTQDQNTAKTLYTERGLRNLLPNIKQEHPFLKVVHSSPLKNTALRLSSAIQEHQKSKKGKRAGAHVNFPKFRKWKQKWFSLFYDEPEKGFKIEGQTLTISLGMGEDRKQRSLSLHLPEAHLLKDKTIRNLRITSELGKYYAIFTLQKNLPSTKPLSKAIALDPNHKNLCYGVDTQAQGIEIAAPSFLKPFDKRIDELKSKRDRCLKKSKKCPVLDQHNKETGKHYFLPSKKWSCYNHSLERALHKRREQTKTFMFTLSHKLYREYDLVAIGDYTPHGEGLTAPMRRAMNNRSLIGRFKKTLSWVGKKSGKTFLEYNEKGTTRTCSCCHNVVEGGIHPSLRTWQCLHCKTIHLRDENAGINGLRKVLWDFSTKGEEITSQVPSSGLALVKERWAWCALPSGVHCTLRGQSCDLVAASGN